jgi:FKBP-type peptidyl-prolyl cis-trans isomerase
MRRFAAALLVPLLAAGAAGLLAGCGNTSPSGDPNASVQVSGKFGQEPKVSIPAEQASDRLTIKTAIRGDGPTVPAGDAILGNFAIYVWHGTRHKLLQSTFHSTPEMLPAQLGLPGLVTALHGQRVGSRVVAVLPPKYGYGTHGNPNVGIAPTDTTVWVVDLIRAYSPTAAASGTHVSDGGGTLPTVSARTGSAPVITMPHAKPPAKLVVKTLIKGTGKPLADHQIVVAQVVGAIWRNGKVFYSTWPSAGSPTGAPFSFQLGGQVISGWNKGLVGIPVGSRVMLVVPPADGYGKEGNSQAGITGTDTLVFVVDILGALPGSST